MSALIFLRLHPPACVATGAPSPPPGIVDPCNRRLLKKLTERWLISRGWQAEMCMRSRASPDTIDRCVASIVISLDTILPSGFLIKAAYRPSSHPDWDEDSGILTGSSRQAEILEQTFASRR